MANEIAIYNRLSVENGTLKYKSDPGLKYVDQTTARLYSEVQEWDDVDTVLAFGDIAAADYGYFRITNLSTELTVRLGPESGGAIDPAIRVLPGESSGWMRAEPGVTWRRQCIDTYPGTPPDTADVQVEMLQA